MFGPPIDDRGAWDHKLAAIKEQGIITKAEEYLKVCFHLAYRCAGGALVQIVER